LKPHVFVGSSSEGVSVAYAIQENLERRAEVAVWDQDVFRPGEYTLESLLIELNRADAGILVFTPDDVSVIRGVEQPVVRDNVLFELGLFVGKIGRTRSFVVAPRGEDLRLPSDLTGINFLEYESGRTDGNLTAALGPACNRVARALQQVAPRRATSERELDLPIFERRDLLTANQRTLLAVFEAESAPTWSTFATALPNATGIELGYRLEQLRLLGFIDVTSTPTGNHYGASCEFRLALGRQRSLIAYGSRVASVPPPDTGRIPAHPVPHLPDTTPWANRRRDPE
jgi:hypothetical protein